MRAPVAQVTMKIRLDGITEQFAGDPAEAIEASPVDLGGDRTEGPGTRLAASLSVYTQSDAEPPAISSPSFFCARSRAVAARSRFEIPYVEDVLKQ